MNRFPIHFRIFVLFSLLGPALVFQADVAASGESIANNHYRLDITQTVVVGSTRKIAMGGAFVGLAEGNDAIPDNPAAVAYRPRAFLKTWEFDMVMGTLVTTNDDTDNSGSPSLVTGNSGVGSLGLMAQYKDFGVGGVARTLLFTSDDIPQDQEAHFLSGVAAVGMTALDRQLAIGFSMTPIGASVASTTDRPVQGRLNQSFKLTGFGYGAGVIWHPDRRHWRFGAAYTSQVSSSEDLVVGSTSPLAVGNLIVPEGVLTTGIFSLGTAYEWNDFPLWHGHQTIATFDTHIFQESPGDANGTKAFLTQTYQPVGQKTIATIHGGLEVEVVPRIMRWRLGTYHEPSRYDDMNARQHITGGFELRLTPFSVWGDRPLAISYAIDHADRYTVHSISLWVYTFTVPVPDTKENRNL